MSVYTVPSSQPHACRHSRRRGGLDANELQNTRKDLVNIVQSNREPVLVERIANLGLEHCRITQKYSPSQSAFADKPLGQEQVIWGLTCPS